jgi:hypothetical protein
MKARHWGWNYVDGVEFFLEEGYKLPEFCPFDKMPSVRCPHRTKGQPIPYAEPELCFSEQAYVYPENVKVETSKVRYTGMTCLPLIRKMMGETNYVPILIEGVRLDNQLLNFLDCLYNEMMMSGRGVVMTGDSNIPYPTFVRRINVRKMDATESTGTSNKR